MVTLRCCQTIRQSGPTSILLLLSLCIGTLTARADTIDLSPKSGRNGALPTQVTKAGATKAEVTKAGAIPGVDALRITPALNEPFKHVPAKFDQPRSSYVAPTNPLQPTARGASHPPKPMIDQAAYALPKAGITFGLAPPARLLNPYRTTNQMPNSWDAATGLGPDWSYSNDKRGNHLRSLSERIYPDRLMRNQLNNRR